jgi:hypothetical protein
MERRTLSLSRWKREIRSLRRCYMPPTEHDPRGREPWPLWKAAVTILLGYVLGWVVVMGIMLYVHEIQH